jgi:serine/threonine protein kinase
MPFVDGESLQQRMTREGPLPATDAYRLLSEIADALAYAHAHGVIHRDVKPANIMIAGEHAVLLDFGVAQAMVESAIDTRITGTGHYVGTTQYMAPEQFASSSDVDGRADVYSLGVVIHEVLTGKLPNDGASSGVVSRSWTNRTPRTIAELRPEVPEALSELVEQALIPAPEARLRTAAALRDGLAAALAQPSRRSYRRPILALALLVGAIAVNVRIAIHPRRRSPRRRALRRHGRRGFALARRVRRCAVGEPRWRRSPAHRSAIRGHATVERPRRRRVGRRARRADRGALRRARARARGRP